MHVARKINAFVRCELGKKNNVISGILGKNPNHNEKEIII